MSPDPNSFPPFAIGSEDAVPIVESASNVAFAGKLRHSTTGRNPSDALEVGDWDWIRWQVYMRCIGPLFVLDPDKQFKPTVRRAFRDARDHTRVPYSDEGINALLVELDKEPATPIGNHLDWELTALYLGYLRTLTAAEPMHVTFGDVSTVYNSAPVKRISAPTGTTAFYFEHPIDTQVCGAQLAPLIHSTATQFAYVEVIKKYGRDSGITIESVTPKFVGAVIRSTANDVDRFATYLLTFSATFSWDGEPSTEVELPPTITPIYAPLADTEISDLFNGLLMSARYTNSRNPSGLARIEPVRLQLASNFLNGFDLS